MENEKPQMPETYLWQSICVTLFCCMPFGIVGIVHASQVSTFYMSGFYKEAEDAAAKAKKWTKLGVCLGIAFWLIYTICIWCLGGVGKFINNA